MGKERIKKIEGLLERYYNSEDSFEQTDLAISLIQGHMGWLLSEAKKSHDTPNNIPTNKVD